MMKRRAARPPSGPRGSEEESTMERNRQAAGMDLYTTMNEIEEQKEALWTAWMGSEDFEDPLRLAIQEVEVRKLENPELNVSVSYQLGRLDGYVELFEQLFRAKERESAVRNDSDLRTDKVCRILRTLYRVGEMRHGELADAVGSSYSSLTNIMKKVLLSGAVEAVRSGRNTRYHLTDAGRRYCEQNLLGEDKFFDRISEAAREGVKKALQSTEESTLAQRLQAGDQFAFKLNNEIHDSVEIKNITTVGSWKFAELCEVVENTEEEETLFVESFLTAWQTRKGV